ncbi:hypothetical protein CP8484711_0301, partial [Chlamydia psittaci 84-8471/1]
PQKTATPKGKKTAILSHSSGFSEDTKTYSLDKTVGKRVLSK